MNFKRVLLSLVLLTLPLLQWAQATPPSLVNYQGVLRSATGAPLTGSYDMRFTFYSSSSGGDQILIDSHTVALSAPVTVTGGLFSVALGSGALSDGSGTGTYTSLAAAFRDYGTVWLDIVVGTETLTPRVQVVAAAYALNADNLDGLDSGDFSLIAHNHTGTYLPLAGGTMAGNIAFSGAQTVDGVDLSVGAASWNNHVASTSNVHGLTYTAEGTGGGLDADLIDGLHASDFLASGADSWVNTTGDTMTGKLTLATTSDTALSANVTSSNTLAWLQNAGSGYPLYAQTTYASSSGSLVPAIIGSSSGASTNGENVGVQGTGQGSATLNYGGKFFGTGNSGTKYGVYAYAGGTNENRAGYFWAKQAGATTNYAVYAEASGATNNYAGYFSGPVSVTGGKLSTAASSTSTAGLNLPHGTAPTTPTNGDLWTTTGGLYARINGATKGPFSDTSYTASNGVTLSGTDFQHADTSAQASSDNSNAVLVQDITLDGFGHLTGLATADMDPRFVNTAGDTMTGKLTTAASASGGAGLTLPHGAAPSTPVNGDIWTTAAGIYARINGATVGPMTSTSSDHGSLSGLADDDHPQYFALAQDETVTGTATFSAAATDIRGQIVDGDSAYVTIGEDAYISGGHLGIGLAPLSTRALNTQLVSTAGESLTGIWANTESTETAPFVATVTGASIDAWAGGGSNDSKVVGIQGQATGISNSTGSHIGVSGEAYGGNGSQTGVYGRAFETNSGDHYGVSGLAEGAGATYGVFGRADGTGTNYGIYGHALSGTTNWGLYTPDNAYVGGALNVGGAMDLGGALDFGAGSNDDLTAADVTDLTDGGETGLHTHDSRYLRKDIADTAAGVITFTAASTDIRGQIVDGDSAYVTIGDDAYVSGGNLGIGTTPSAYRGVNLLMVTSSTSSTYGVYASLNATETGASFPTVQGGYFQGTHSGAGNDSSVYGVRAYGSGPADSTGAHVGMVGSAFGGTGVHYGVQGLAEDDTISGWIGEHYGVYGSATAGPDPNGNRHSTGVYGIGDYAGGTFDDRDGAYTNVAISTYKVYGTGGDAFVQNHPFEKDKVIVYAAPEGDEMATYTRGSARLTNGEVRVKLGETFQWVTNPDIGLTAHLTPRGEAVPLAVKDISTTELVVTGPSDVAFDYIVYGLRIGFEEVSIVAEKQREAYIPNMNGHRQLFDRQPSLRSFNPIERFKGMRAEMGITKPLDLSPALALKEAIHEFQSGVDNIQTWQTPPVAGAKSALNRIAPARAQEVANATGRRSEPSPEQSLARPPIASVTVAPPALPRTERFPVCETVQPGDVLANAPEHPGTFCLARLASDPGVVGIVVAEPSGYAPPPVGSESGSSLEFAPVAAGGVVLCKADATLTPIAANDLLVASPIPGHAMKAPRPVEPGTVIGKALEPLASGTGMIKVLVMLR
jgi:hypothetical protein